MFFVLQRDCVKMISEAVWPCVLVLHGVLGAVLDIMSVSVMEGDPVTLHNNINVTKDQKIKWYFNSTRIAQIDLLIRKICTDVHCNEGTERFRGRLKLDHQTGSLTIMDTRNTDSGLYHLEINSEEKFTVTVYNVTTTDKPEKEAGRSVGAKAGIGVGVVLVLLAGGLYYSIQEQEMRGQPSGATITYRHANQDDHEPGNEEEDQTQIQ